MAHIMKCKDIGAIGIIKHINRENKNYGNEDVDTSKSKDNIYFIKRSYEYYKNRMENDLYVYGGWNDKNKAKYNSLCSIAVHCLDSCENEEEFFKALNEIFKKRYGEENVICSVVHKDEKRSHLHFTFIPCIYNEKKKKYQLSYEKCIAHSFDSFHSDLEKELKEQYDIDVKLADKENNDKFYIDNIKDYKKMKDALKSLETEKQSLQNENAELKEKNQFLNNANTKFKNDNLELRKQHTQMKNENQKLINDNKQLQNEIVEQQNIFQNLLLKIQKTMNVFFKIQKKEKEVLGYSTLDNDIANLQKEFVEAVR
ncbi:MAG: plasmid recombination protein [Lachnospiraceae bacterium]|nr:plasmid recombination protein [Lachnospiraceae bacterium]